MVSSPGGAAEASCSQQPDESAAANIIQSVALGVLGENRGAQQIELWSMVAEERQAGEQAKAAVRGARAARVCVRVSSEGEGGAFDDGIDALGCGHLYPEHELILREGGVDHQLSEIVGDAAVFIDRSLCRVVENWGERAAAAAATSEQKD